MRSALLVDDNGSERETKEKLLRSIGLSVFAPEAERVSDFHDGLVQVFNQGSTVFDLLVLDIVIGVDLFGGIDLYNKLVDGGYRARWRNVFIWTKQTYDDIAKASFRKRDSSNEQYILRVFCETAGIPYGNVQRSDHGGVKNLKEKVTEILALPGDKICRQCGRGI